MRFTRPFQSLFGDAMIIYEKIQGKVVETRSFFSTPHLYVQYVLYPTRGDLETYCTLWCSVRN